MHRTIPEAAATLGMGQRALFAKLRELKVIDHKRELMSPHHGAGRFFSEPRRRWDHRINGWTHYAIVKVTEEGITWLAKKLDITITTMPARTVGSNA